MGTAMAIGYYTPSSPSNNIPLGQLSIDLQSSLSGHHSSTSTLGALLCPTTMGLPLEAQIPCGSMHHLPSNVDEHQLHLRVYPGIRKDQKGVQLEMLMTSSGSASVVVPGNATTAIEVEFHVEEETRSFTLKFPWRILWRKTKH